MDANHQLESFHDFNNPDNPPYNTMAPRELISYLYTSEVHFSIATISDHPSTLVRLWPWGKPLVDSFSVHMLPAIYSTYVWNLLSAAGWCRRLVDRITRLPTPAAIFYLYMIGPPRSKFHRGLCTSQLCRWSIVDAANYEVVHTDEGNEHCGDCKWVKFSSRCLGLPDAAGSQTIWGPNPSHLEAILDTGKIPIILVQGGPESGRPLQLRVVGCDFKNHPFVAFSHVWSHGRGNPQHNRMHICQLGFRKRL
jgi:hypothetical protein